MLGAGVVVGESELEAEGVGVGRGRGRGARTAVLRWQEKTGNKRYMCSEISKNKFNNLLEMRELRFCLLCVSVCRFEVLLFKYECWLGLLIPSKYP